MYPGEASIQKTELETSEIPLKEHHCDFNFPPILFEYFLSVFVR
jgi:hypothetical protein